VPGYRIVRKLGRGAMGIVHLALREADNTAVALKTILPAVAAHPEQVGRFLREAEILKGLDHRNIVAFREMGEVSGQLWFAMEFVPGTDAGRLLKNSGPLGVVEATRLVCQALSGVAYAHGRKVVHRDIKPSNLLLHEGEGRRVVKLADFGLARFYQASQLSGLTMTGTAGGTLGFMPPEQVTDYREAQPPADQYSVAATLYHLLTGKFLFDIKKGGDLEMMLLILDKDPVPLRQRRKDVPAALATAVHRALAKDPAERFADVLEMREALLPFAK
jgi:serine/threonine-protein kinase